MSDLQLSFLLDTTMIVLLFIRIHREDIYESGSFLRLGLFLGFIWLVFADIDGMTAFFDIVTGWPGSFPRTGVFKLVIMLGTLIDIFRAYRKLHDIGPTARALLIEESKREKV